MQFHNDSDYVGKYLKRVQKRIAGKPLAMQLIMDRTFGTATWVLQLINNVPFQQITAGAYAISAALPQKELARQFEAQLELAGANEEKIRYGTSCLLQQPERAYQKEAS